MKLDILVFGAHPDDVELGCSGTILASIATGNTVGIIDLTKGELGTRGTATIRLQEAKVATKILGVKIRENLNLADGFFEINKKTILKVIEKIRQYQPSIVICNAPTDRHPDHGRASKLIYESFFLAGLSKIDTTNKNRKQEAWKANYLFNYIQDKYLEPNFLIDISPYIEKKIQSIKAYQSQFHNPNFKGASTYISSPKFLSSITDRNSLFGKRIGVAYAEGFLTEKIIGLNNFNSIILNKT